MGWATFWAIFSQTHLVTDCTALGSVTESGFENEKKEKKFAHFFLSLFFI
jgi:hypothetical protein